MRLGTPPSGAGPHLFSHHLGACVHCGAKARLSRTAAAPALRTLSTSISGQITPDEDDTTRPPRHGARLTWMAPPHSGPPGFVEAMRPHRYGNRRPPVARRED